MAPKKDIKDWLKKAENLNDQTNGLATPFLSYHFNTPTDGRYVAKEYQEAFGGNIVGNIEFPEDVEHENMYPMSSSHFANLTLKIDDDQWIQITDSMGTGLGAYNKCIRLEVGDVKGAYAVFERVARRKGQGAPAIEYREVEGGTKIAARFVDGCGLTWILVGPVGNASTSNN